MLYIYILINIGDNQISYTTYIGYIYIYINPYKIPWNPYLLLVNHQPGPLGSGQPSSMSIDAHHGASSASSASGEFVRFFYGEVVISMGMNEV